MEPIFANSITCRHYYDLCFYDYMSLFSCSRLCRHMCIGKSSYYDYTILMLLIFSKPDHIVQFKKNC